jgi:23S rRNA (cytosine1962-C5)-methyltransferase
MENVKKGDRVLNLFGYTGAASICAAKAGGDVFHVDSSKSIVKRAGENAQINEVGSIHWVVEDALAFAKKEEKREKKYRFVIMDPPIYGRGKKGEHWKLEDQLPLLMRTAKNILTKDGFLILNTYSPKINLERMSELARDHHLTVLRKGWLSVQSEKRKLALSRYLLCGCA